MDPRSRRRQRLAMVGTGSALLGVLAFAPLSGEAPQVARVTSEQSLVGSFSGATGGKRPTSGGLAAAALTAPASTALAEAACIGDVVPKAKPWYPGPSTSVLYDTTFGSGPALPDLDEYTPQGLAAWPNWDGAGHSLLLVAAYQLGHHSRLYGIDPTTGKVLGTVRIAASHLGGIAIAGDWLFTQANSALMLPEGVNKFPLADLRAKLLAPGKPIMSPVGDPQTIYSADFMTSYGGDVWAGQYNIAAPDKMFRYAVYPDGTLAPVGDAWQVPARTQGALVTEDKFVFVASDSSPRGRMWVVRRGEPDLAKATGTCFRNPDLGQGMAILDGKAFVSYESGSRPFAKKKSTPNKIRNLHQTTLDALNGLVDAVPGVVGLGG